MKHWSGVAIIAAATVAIGAVRPGAVHQDEAAVRAAVQHYLDGHATGDGAHMRIAFHPEAKLFFIRNGAFTQRTSEDYIAGFSGQPAPDEAQRRRRIDDVDVTGTAAVARVVLDYPNALFTDYLSLLKIGDEWKVVNKIFHVEPKGD
jgi:hypothetical protein